MVDQLVFNVGRQLRNLRSELGLSLRQLSERVGVAPSTIQKIENNQISPTLGTMVKIAQGMNKDLQFFLEPAHERTDVVFCSKAQRRRIDPPDVKFSLELLTEGLSDQKVSALLVADVIQDANVRVIQGSKRLRLAFEALPHLSVGGPVMGKHFDGNYAVETRIRGFVHLAHAAHADRLENLIRTEAHAR